MQSRNGYRHFLEESSRVCWLYIYIWKFSRIGKFVAIQCFRECLVKLRLGLLPLNNSAFNSLFSLTRRMPATTAVSLKMIKQLKQKSNNLIWFCLLYKNVRGKYGTVAGPQSYNSPRCYTLVDPSPTTHHDVIPWWTPVLQLTTMLYLGGPQSYSSPRFYTLVDPSPTAHHDVIPWWTPVLQQLTTMLYLGGPQSYNNSPRCYTLVDPSPTTTHHYVIPWWTPVLQQLTTMLYLGGPQSYNSSPRCYTLVDPSPTTTHHDVIPWWTPVLQQLTTTLYLGGPQSYNSSPRCYTLVDPSPAAHHDVLPFMPHRILQRSQSVQCASVNVVENINTPGNDEV